MARLRTVVGKGDRARSLDQVRDLLAETLESAEPQYVARLAAELRDTLREIDDLNPPKNEDSVDDLAARRASRHQSTPVSKRSGSGD